MGYDEPKLHLVELTFTCCGVKIIKEVRIILELPLTVEWSIVQADPVLRSISE